LGDAYLAIIVKAQLKAGDTDGARETIDQAKKAAGENQRAGETGE
jgi:hypothetical protein